RAPSPHAARLASPHPTPAPYGRTAPPAGMTIDAAGLVTWQPTPAQFGPNPVQVRVEDGRGGFAAQAFSVNVVTQAGNQPPGIVSTPPPAPPVGRPYAYDLGGSAPDGDPPAWGLDAAPAGTAVDPSRGTVRWTPTADQVGSQAVVVRVLDRRGGFATQSFAVTVRAVNVPPAITSTPPTQAAVGAGYSYAVRATDPENDP